MKQTFSLGRSFLWLICLYHYNVIVHVSCPLLRFKLVATFSICYGHRKKKTISLHFLAALLVYTEVSISSALFSKLGSLSSSSFHVSCFLDIWSFQLSFLRLYFICLFLSPSVISETGQSSKGGLSLAELAHEHVMWDSVRNLNGVFQNLISSHRFPKITINSFHYSR